LMIEGTYQQQQKMIKTIRFADKKIETGAA
jgi:hypothetical protein